MIRSGQSCPSLLSGSSFGQPSSPGTVKRKGYSCPSLNSESGFGRPVSPRRIPPATKKNRKDTKDEFLSSTNRPPFPQSFDHRISSRTNSGQDGISALSTESLRPNSLSVLQSDRRSLSWPLINDQRSTLSSAEQITQKASTSPLSIPRATSPISGETEGEMPPANNDTGPPEANDAAAACTLREELSTPSIRESTQLQAVQGSTKVSVGGNALSLATLDTIREEPSDAIVENALLQATSAISAEPSVVNAGENALSQAVSDVTTKESFFNANARENAPLPATSDTSTEEPADVLVREDSGMPLVPISPYAGIQNNREVRIQSGQNYKEGFQILLENARLKKLINCTQCLCSERNTVFLPCGHFALCRGCAHGLAKCSMCDMDITMMITVTSTFSSGGFELE